MYDSRFRLPKQTHQEIKYEHQNAHGKLLRLFQHIISVKMGAHWNNTDEVTNLQITNLFVY